MEAVTSRGGVWGRRIAWAAADAGVCCVCYWFLTDFFFSAHAQRFEVLADFMKISGIFCLVCFAAAGASRHAALKRQHGRKGMLLHVLLCIPAHILFAFLVLLNYLYVNIRIFPPGDFHDAHGILYILVVVPYFACAALLRLGVLAIHLIRSPKGPVGPTP